MTAIERLNKLPDYCVNLILTQVIGNPNIKEQVKTFSLDIEFKNESYNHLHYNINSKDYIELEAYKKS